MTILADYRPVRLVGDEPWSGSLHAFFAANEDMDLAEQLAIQGALDRQGFATGGGGAAAEWRLETVRRPLCPVCSNRGWISTYKEPSTDSIIGAPSSFEAMRARDAERLAAPRVRCPKGCEPRPWDIARLEADAKILAQAEKVRASA